MKHVLYYSLYNVAVRIDRLIRRAFEGEGGLGREVAAPPMAMLKCQRQQ